MTDHFPTDDVVAAVTRHMNGEHAADNAVICRGVGGHPEVESAVMTGMDASAIEFRAETPSGPIMIRIPFSRTLRERAQIREEAARMFHESVSATGDEPGAL